MLEIVNRASLWHLERIPPPYGQHCNVLILRKLQELPRGRIVSKNLLSVVEELCSDCKGRALCCALMRSNKVIICYLKTNKYGYVV